MTYLGVGESMEKGENGAEGHGEGKDGGRGDGEQVAPVVQSSMTIVEGKGARYLLGIEATVRCVRG